jgi:flagellar protein FlbD
VQRYAVCLPLRRYNVGMRGDFFMIMVTRINKVERFYINEELIEFIEETPDTVISMESGKKVVVMENAGTVIDRIIQEKRKLYRYWDEKE